MLQRHEMSVPGRNKANCVFKLTIKYQFKDYFHLIQARFAVIRSNLFHFSGHLVLFSNNVKIK